MDQPTLPVPGGAHRFALRSAHLIGVAICMGIILRVFFPELHQAICTVQH